MFVWYNLFLFNINNLLSCKMKLNIHNFFTHLIVHPFDAEKNDRKSVLVASIALGIFSLFAVHLACLIYRFFAKKVEVPSQKDLQASKVAEESSIKSKPPSKTVKKEGRPIEEEPTPLAEKSFGSAKVRVYQADLLKHEVDAIVNPANTRLQGGGGLDGIIGSAAGRSIYDECASQLKEKKITACNTGDAYITGSGRLSSRGIKHVIHAVGPRGSTTDGDRLLKSAYMNSLLRAHEEGLTSIALPCISIGIFNFNPTRAAEISYQAIHEFFRQHPDTSVRDVRLSYWTGDKDVESMTKILDLFY